MTFPAECSSKYTNFPSIPAVAAGCPEKFVFKIRRLSMDTLLGFQPYSNFGRSWGKIIDDMFEARANFGTPDMIVAYTYYLSWAELLRARLGIKRADKSEDLGQRRHPTISELRGVRDEIEKMRAFVRREASVATTASLGNVMF